MRRFTYMNRREWISLNELTWMNWKEWIDMNDCKRMNCQKWSETLSLFKCELELSLQFLHFLPPSFSKSLPNVRVVFTIFWPKMSQNLLCDTFVKLNQILSGIFTYTLLGICSFPFFAYSYFCKILGGHIKFVLNNRLVALFMTCGWTFLCTKSKVFHVHFGNDLLCLLCFPQSQEDSQRTKDMHF